MKLLQKLKAHGLRTELMVAIIVAPHAIQVEYTLQNKGTNNEPKRHIESDRYSYLMLVGKTV
jgi:hypothetical protein